MRSLSKMTIGLLLGAAVLLPAMAQERGRWRGDSGRPAASDDGAARAAVAQGREAARQVERPAPAMQSAPVAAEGRRQWQGGNRDGNRGSDDGNRQRGWNRGGDNDGRQRNWDRGDRVVAVPQGNPPPAARTDDRRQDDDRRRDWNRDRGNDRDQHWNSDRREWNRDRDNDRNRRDWNRNWTSDRHDWDRRDNDRWDRNWRTDRRYDWQNYRTRNRAIYRMPRYVAPRGGYSYRRWSPGFRWDPWFYSSSYWIADPWYYRLPPAYGDYRWVRYYNDAVLVDVRTGEIIDVIYAFFF